ncbi:hypothetical protein GCM10022631_41690 [Deinococcus rubellus]|uniref:Uncharacterized protein n=1 Tax=Deinococcus rubellus TaxID=1889240 RepID=A0ABY5YL22_9DEIO|nr:hypothetical protein [Deinococcus rubellus]UWX65047.1 hypothetical protein N0D28_05160 [Deinococcus rubellus]
MPNTQTLLGINGLREEYSFGRDLATQLAELMPHIVAGRAGRGPRRLVHRADLERLLAHARADQVDLWALVKQPDARTVIQNWLTPKAAN